MSSYRFRLILPVSLIILLVLAGLGAVLGPFIQDFYQDRMVDRIEKEAETAAFAIEQRSADQELQEVVSALAERLEARLTLIDADGTVLADSSQENGDMSSRENRPEVIGARGGGEPFSIRFSETVNTELLYYVVPLELTEEEGQLLRIGVEMDELQDVYQNVWTLLIVSFFVAFVIIVALITRLTNELIRPVEDARRVANELARGNFSARTYEGVDLEIGELNRSINVMAENLEQVTKTYENQQERLETLIENMGSGLILINAKGDITLLNRSCSEIFEEDTAQWQNQLYYNAINNKKMIKFVQELFLKEEPIRRQMKWPSGIYIRHFDVHGAPVVGQDGKLKGIVLVFHDITELKKLEQARKDFVANVSHELKTPVTSLKGFTETLLDGAMNDEAAMERFLTIIAKEAVRLEELITDLLELSKIEGEHFQLNWDEVDYGSLAEETLLLLKEKAAAKSMNLETKIQGDTTAPGDHARLKQVFLNLVNNAVVYTPEGGDVRIKVTGQKENVVVEVSDTGIGISKKEIPRVFERFYRVDRARSRNSGGTGLGLAIVKHLAEAHHAELAVDSRPGKGTTFRLVFSRYPFGS
ncbi:two-component system histidine kinase PnpS [Alkalicoccus urumqiensis]|uniref:histidine kinase n=1 Tax=Alkalicoccus urumqiensis TaxID=1548213 RepID=A0A2P6MDG5_ALKUR|nr:ATP-binding protein [Alkalicoccus urumqiensis]PRO64313.1 PAS domain-containing sensor histidine kinase [Alkalicoccus urumqiensis]